jgi:hypothetical protein
MAVTTHSTAWRSLYFGHFLGGIVRINEPRDGARHACCSLYLVSLAGIHVGQGLGGTPNVPGPESPCQLCVREEHPLSCRNSCEIPLPHIKSPSESSPSTHNAEREEGVN